MEGACSLDEADRLHPAGFVVHPVLSDLAQHVF